MRIQLGRHVFGLAVISYGVISLAWQEFGVWQQIPSLGAHREVLGCVAAAVEILGGLAIQWRRTARTGGIAVSILFLVFALIGVPSIVAGPRVYNNWGNFFEQFSQAMGAFMVYAAVGRSDLGHSPRTGRIGYLLLGICVMSFAVSQFIYLRVTASLVPKWIPPGQVFWAIATTVAFALAAIALITNRLTLLASRLLTAMLLGFNLLVWLPICFGEPHKFFNWSENVETLAIAGAAWIVADYLSQEHSKMRPMGAEQE